jgi:hypothetical protein
MANQNKFVRDLTSEGRSRVLRASGPWRKILRLHSKITGCLQPNEAHVKFLMDNWMLISVARSPQAAC